MSSKRDFLEDVKYSLGGAIALLPVALFSVAFLLIPIFEKIPFLDKEGQLLVGMYVCLFMGMLAGRRLK